LLLLDAAYWKKLGQDLLEKEMEKQRYNTRAKNVILFLGDGMSIPTITAARIYKGQKDGKPGEETDLTFDKFPFVALSRVRSISVAVILKM
jgi:alkaline phosphatase